MMNNQELIPHLFRTEFSKISAVLSKLFGIEHIETAEDIASETFLAALETWSYKGIPQNPTAWLYSVAKNKTLNYIKRNKLFTEKISGEIKHAAEKIYEPDLSEQNITDSQLQMMFALCHPSINTESQVALSLRILCGFGIDEIANAFLSNKETISKRLYRAKEILREENATIEMPPVTAIDERLDAVLTTIYLLFNEGYYSETNDAVLREELCTEAMRLCGILLQNQQTNLPKANALYALMCFHASRFAARKNEHGEIILYEDQNENLWDKNLITEGTFHLNLASQGNKVSTFHLEAGIAYWHTIKENSKEKWENILQLYNRLLQIAYSPVAALNRTFALSKANGKQAAIKEAEKLQLTNNPYYHTLLGELYKGIDNNKAHDNLNKALSLAKTQADKQIILKKIEAL